MKRLTLWMLPCLVFAAQGPTLIHVDSRLVQVDVTVRNGKGPVRGLTKDDFTLLDKGKPQPVALFKVTEAGQPGGEGVTLPPGMVSNRINQGTDTPGSVTVILVDRLNMPPIVQPYADRELLRFLQSAQKGDHIAIYVLAQQIHVVQDFTTDLERLKTAARRRASWKPIGPNRLKASFAAVQSACEIRSWGTVVDGNKLMTKDMTGSRFAVGFAVLAARRLPSCRCFLFPTAITV